MYKIGLTKLNYYHEFGLNFFFYLNRIMKNGKPGSILKIKDFSESEDDEEQEVMQVDQSEDEEIEEPEDQPGTSKSAKLKDKQKKKGKKGIIYISTIPQHMNVAICREFMERFGDVSRIFLQPDSKGSKKKSPIRNSRLTENLFYF